MPYIPEKNEKTEEREPVQRRSIRKERRLLVMSLISCAAIIFGTVHLIQYYSELNSSRNTSRELQAIMEAADPAAEEPTVIPAQAAAVQTEQIPAQAAAVQTEQIPAQTAAVQTEQIPAQAAAVQTAQVPAQAAAEQTESVSAEASSVQPAPAPADGAPGENPVQEVRAEASLHTPIPGIAKDTNILQPVPYPDNQELSVSDRFRRLRRKGEYIVGWLTMDHLSEAVVQKDNTFFLNHDATGNNNSNGAIFLDEATGIITRPYTLILYGHNMKSGNMFGRLKKYKENAYFFSNRIISFDSMFEDGKYAVFAVLEFSTVPGTSGWFDLYSLRSDHIDARTEAIRKLENKSVHGRMLDVQPEDQLLLLVTCVDGEDERLLVAARRLRPNEKEEGLTFLQTGRNGNLPSGS